ncbi:MAG: helix-turn-helix domain-containing protein [Oscillochloridaceae bacterium]|nr:helix-turn-helix domain-containing protein [Chloroflexaceae bacterium]MDW8391223.1 helix-turn-helix domain-containing protein [Oscillochloridaceae bacterium]
MPLRQFEVINHPVRMRIFQLLHRTRLSINQLARLLPDVPRPSLYRHMHKLLAAGVVEVAATRLVHGIEERLYTAVSELIDPDEVYRPGGLESFADHVAIYGTVVAQELARHVLAHGAPDLNNIAARDHVFYATEGEFLHLRETIYELLASIEQQPPAPGRSLRRLFLMAHPMLSAMVDATDDRKEHDE